MSSFDILLSNLRIKIEHKFDYMPKFCKDYISEFNEYDIVANTDENSVLKEKELVPTASIEACESLCIYRAIAEQLPQFNRFVFHGAAIKYDGDAYLFTAPSGTGKTTHINLWRRYLGDKVSIINGDKPIISIDDAITVYGTPWAGKEGYQKNTSARLRAICVLKQGKNNSIVRLQPSDVVNRLMRQVYMPKNPATLSETLALIGKMIETVDVYELTCDISEEAFKTSFDVLTK